MTLPTKAILTHFDYVTLPTLAILIHLGYVTLPTLAILLIFVLGHCQLFGQIQDHLEFSILQCVAYMFSLLNCEHLKQMRMCVFQRLFPFLFVNDRKW